MISKFIKGDARQAFDVLKGGGIAIIPMDVGYTCAGGSREALQKIFNTKKTRRFQKKCHGRRYGHC